MTKGSGPNSTGLTQGDEGALQMLQGDPPSKEVLKFLEEGEEGVGGGNAIGGGPQGSSTNLPRGPREGFPPARW